MQFSTATVALWTILSSSAATAKGLCRPSAFGMYVRRDGVARYAPRWTRACRSVVSVKVCGIGLPRQSVHPGGGVALEHEERLTEQIDAEVKERGELLLPPL